jgi:hypothetical protein
VTGAETFSSSWPASCRPSTSLRAASKDVDGRHNGTSARSCVVAPHLTRPLRPQWGRRGEFRPCRESPLRPLGRRGRVRWGAKHDHARPRPQPGKTHCRTLSIKYAAQTNRTRVGSSRPSASSLSAAKDVDGRRESGHDLEKTRHFITNLCDGRNPKGWGGGAHGSPAAKPSFRRRANLVGASADPTATGSSNRAAHVIQHGAARGNASCRKKHRCSACAARRP